MHDVALLSGNLHQAIEQDGINVASARQFFEHERFSVTVHKQVLEFLKELVGQNAFVFVFLVVLLKQEDEKIISTRECSMNTLPVLQTKQLQSINLH